MAKVGLDNFQRASYLYQLSWAALRSRPDQPAASHHYSHMLTEFCQKAVLRMEPQMKRTVCSACHVLLVPGTTCTVRTRSRPQRCQVWRCRACGQCRRFPCPRPSEVRKRKGAAQSESETPGQANVGQSVEKAGSGAKGENARREENMRKGEDMKKGGNTWQGGQARKGENTWKGGQKKKGENSWQGGQARKGQNSWKGDQTRKGGNTWQGGNMTTHAWR